MSQFPSPSEIFDGSTNWVEAQGYVNAMVSYLVNETNCCNKKPLDCNISFMYFAMQIDSPEQLDNSERWHNDIESIYRTLYPYT